METGKNLTIIINYKLNYELYRGVYVNGYNSLSLELDETIDLQLKDIVNRAVDDLGIDLYDLNYMIYEN